MTRVGVSGATGRMGRLVAETVAYATGFELAALYDPNGGGQVVAGVERGEADAERDGEEPPACTGGAQLARRLQPAPQLRAIEGTKLLLTLQNRASCFAILQLLICPRF